jgi:hypothetical protein
MAEISCPTKYFPEASSINFRRSVQYGLGVLGVSLAYRAHQWHLGTPKFLDRRNAETRTLLAADIAARIAETNVSL